MSAVRDTTERIVEAPHPRDLPPRSSLSGHLVFDRVTFGYVEGQSIAIEYRWAEGKYERLSDLAAELVRLKLDVIVAVATPAVQAAKQATKAIPIVMLSVGDPVASGFVASVARPGGNITGLANIATELVGKQLQLLREVLPNVSLVTVLWNPTNPSNASQLREAAAAARASDASLLD